MAIVRAETPCSLFAGKQGRSYSLLQDHGAEAVAGWYSNGFSFVLRRRSSNHPCGSSTENHALSKLNKNRKVA